MKRIVVDKPVDVVYAEDVDLERGGYSNVWPQNRRLSCSS